MSEIQKIQSIKEEIDSYTDIDKLKALLEAKTNEYKTAAVSAVTSKVGLVTAALPQGAGAVATAAILQAKVAASTLISATEKATVLALLAQKIEQLVVEKSAYIAAKAQQAQALVQQAKDIEAQAAKKLGV